VAADARAPLIRVAVGATCSKPGDLAGNLAQVDGLSARAALAGCDLLLTPELSATGYGGYADVIACRERAGQGPIQRSLARTAARDHLVVCAGFVEEDGAKSYLAHYAVFPDGAFVVQRKHRVTPVEAPLDPAVPLVYDGSEKIGHVRPGDESFHVVTVKGVRCALVICADLGVRGLGPLLQSLGVQLMLLPSGAGGQPEERVMEAELATDEGREKLARILSAPLPDPGLVVDNLRFRRATAAVNMAGWDGRDHWHGGSGSITGPRGDVLAVLPGCPVIDRARPMLAWADVEVMA
jgi:predicted amidohydrolase